MGSSLEHLVWERARSRCEYCQMPQAFDGFTHEIDHVIAKKHGGPTTAGNLALAWVGLFLGVCLALSARAGSWPKRDARTLVRPVLILLVFMGMGAFLAGIVGWMLTGSGLVFLVEPLATLVPREKHVAFLADLWAHSASYSFGFMGGTVVIYRVLRDRRKTVSSMHSEPERPLLR